MPTVMHRAASGSSSADRLRQSSASGNKSPVRFQIQLKRNPIVQYKSGGIEPHSRRRTADAEKPVISQGTGDSVDCKATSRTEALKSLSLYASEDSDSEYANEVISRNKQCDSSKASSDSVAAATKVRSSKTDDSIHSSRHNPKKDNSGLHETESQGGHRDKRESDRRRSLSKERRRSTEHKRGWSKDRLGNKSSREYAKSGDDHRSGKKSREDDAVVGEKVGSDKFSDCRSKKSRESSSHSGKETLQAQRDTSKSKQSSLDRHHENSSTSTEPRKPERVSLPAESDSKTLPTIRQSSDTESKSTNKENSGSKPKPNEAEPRKKVDTSHSGTKTLQAHHGTSKSKQSSLDRHREDCETSKETRKPERVPLPAKNDSKTLSTVRQSSDAESRITNKETVIKENSGSKPKPNEAQPHKKADTDLKSTKKDHSRYADDREEHDTVKKSKKAEPVDQRKEKLHREKTAKVKDAGDDKKHKVASSQSRKASSSNISINEKKSAGSRKSRKVSVSSSSSCSGSGSGSSSDSDSDSSTSSSSGSSSCGSSSQSCYEDVAASKKKSSRLLARPCKDPSKPPPLIQSEPQKANIRDVSEDKGKSDCDEKSTKIFSGNVPPHIACMPVDSILTEETMSGVDKPMHRERSVDTKPEPVAVHSGVSNVKVSLSDAPVQKLTTELYSPSFPTDVDRGWEDEACGDAARWSSSSESDVDDLPPPPPPPPPPSNTVQRSSNRHSPVVPKPVTESSKKDTTPPGSGAAPDNNGPAVHSVSVSDTQKPVDGELKKKDGVESALPKIDDGCTESEVEVKSGFGRHDKTSVSGSRTQAAPYGVQQDRSRSSHASDRSRRSRSRSRSQERRYRASRDGRRSQNPDDGRRHVTTSEKTNSRRRESRRSESPAIICDVDSPDFPPVVSSPSHFSSSRRLGQHYSDARQKSSSYGSDRSSTLRQPSSSSKSTGRNAFMSDEPVVVIDTDDEDMENLESIPLPTDVTNIALDDIPLPVPVSRSSNATAEASNTSEIHSPKNKLDCTPAVEHGKESDCTETSQYETSLDASVLSRRSSAEHESESHESTNRFTNNTAAAKEKMCSECEGSKTVSVVKQGEESEQKSTVEEVVKEEVGRCDTDCVDNVDMDLDDIHDDVCQSEQKNTDAVPTEGQKGPSFPGKIVLSIGSRTQTVNDKSTSKVLSSDSSNTAWKRKLAAGLLKAPKLLTSKTETASDENSDENSVSVLSTASHKKSDPVTEIECRSISKKPSSQMGESTKLLCNAAMVEESFSNSNTAVSNSSTAVVKEKVRRRFSDSPPEKAANLSGDPHSESSARTVEVVKVYGF